jgi:hypothetical protein
MADPWKDAVEDVRSGMSCAREEWESLAANQGFYDRHNRAYFEGHSRRESEGIRDFEDRPKQFSYMTHRAVRCLTQRLYTPGPSRTIQPEPAAAFLDAVYEASKINAVMQRADAMATLNGACAIQAVAPGVPEEPIRLYLWGRHEFKVYHADDDPMRPVVIVTKSVVPGTKRGTKRRKYQIWAAEQYATYYTKDFDYRTPDGTAADQIDPSDSGRNPYGMLPFAFVFHELPVDRFDNSGGIGTSLRECNLEVDRMLSDLAELLEAYNRPEGFARNTPQEWTYSRKAGRFSILRRAKDAEELGGEADVFYLQPQVDVESAWRHITEYQNAVFEDLEIPIRAVRGQATATAESGVAILAQMAPLTDYIRARQPAFALYEQELARMLLRTAGAYYQDAGLLASADALTMDLVWPPIAPPIPSAEFDKSLQDRYAMGVMSLIGLVQACNGMTRDAAVKHLQQVAADREEERAILGDAAPQTTGEGQAIQQEQFEAKSKADDDESDTDKGADDGEE